MIKASDILSEAHFATEHVSRLKQLTRSRPLGRPLQRRVCALEEAALRMELEARARSVRHWRAQLDLSVGPMSNVGVLEAPDSDCELAGPDAYLRQRGPRSS